MKQQGAGRYILEDNNKILVEAIITRKIQRADFSKMGTKKTERR